jgi:hypothetical protein
MKWRVFYVHLSDADGRVHVLALQWLASFPWEWLGGDDPMFRWAIAERIA